MVPKFIPIDLANQILVVGKSINFLLKFRKTGKPIHPNLPKVEAFIQRATHGDKNNLLQIVEIVSNHVDENLKSLLVEDYHLFEHIKALKKFMLLGQGDFFGCLFDLFGPELSKSADRLFRQNLNHLLDGALRSSNAQFKKPEILNRVSVKLLNPTLGDTGWEVFTLDYSVEPPLNAVVS
jgi:gamma-tubulin complex component 3